MELKREARKYAEDLQQGAAILEREVGDLKKQIDERLAKIDSANLAYERVETFNETRGGDFQCPRCWIFHGVRASLRPIGSDTRIDYFRCETCEASFLA
jgi:hypothetical protein